MTDEDLVMSWLEDEESKYILKKRIEYNKTNDFNAIRAIVSRYLPQLRNRRYYPGIEAEMLKKVNGKRKIVIFGAGMNAKTVVNLLENAGYAVDAIVDNDRTRWGCDINGIIIKNPETVAHSDIDIFIVSLYKEKWIEEIHEQLAEYGVDSNKIIDYRDYCPYMLEDEQYFDEKIIHLKQNEIFIDGGVLDLGTSIQFEQFCRKQGVKNYKVYAFEPDYKSFMKCNSMIKDHPEFNIQLCNAGLWSCNTTLYFSNQGDGGSKIVDKESDCSIEVVSLDNCITDNVTFIKLDIEGAEMEALKGASNIIKTQKPKLAICVYHKKEDITEIPMLIKNLVPEYKLYLRHYSNDAVETVLYAV